MNKLIPLLLIVLTLGCSELFDPSGFKEIDISISSDHKILSNQKVIKDTVSSLLLNQPIDYLDVTNELYTKTWVNAFHSKRKSHNKYNIKVKEYLPLAKWGNGRYLTHSGLLINPSFNNTSLNLLILRGPESGRLELLDISRQIQAQLNRYDEIVEEINLSSDGYLRVITQSGTKLTFSKKSFREQLERLEDFISFELFSGKLNNIRNMDFRYNNGISILF